MKPAPTSPYAPLWAHIDKCAQCSWAMHRLCDDGRRLLERATRAASQLLAPIPDIMKPRAKA